MSKSLHASCGARIDVYLLWLASAGTLAAGLSLPVITLTELIFNKSTYSILSGIIELFQNKDHVLAAVIFVFSFVFPIVKLGSLLFLWFIAIDKNSRGVVVGWLGQLGKWSMLDVYIVAMTVIIAKSSVILKAEPEIGIYFFGASVILSILTSMRIEFLSKKAH